ncbi:uncharacterized protein LOC129765420 isoform X4 [Toxorhynchites rutilus septentrionalis]|uniref:uncharacterized protein LOC129765420 isoform X4 n=1 Tax=Toxorhynchites rutilus septentrionalis TaxID=329112 RepID=UPI002479F300|nr:uncharacterized protein LOC129765420 isoform X4 [Toxorhynchites rutilus septentrionalis]
MIIIEKTGNIISKQSESKLNTSQIDVGLKHQRKTLTNNRETLSVPENARIHSPSSDYESNNISLPVKSQKAVTNVSAIPPTVESKLSNENIQNALSEKKTFRDQQLQSRENHDHNRIEKYLKSASNALKSESSAQLESVTSGIIISSILSPESPLLSPILENTGSSVSKRGESNCKSSQSDVGLRHHRKTLTNNRKTLSVPEHAGIHSPSSRPMESQKEVLKVSAIPSAIVPTHPSDEDQSVPSEKKSFRDQDTQSKEDAPIGWKVIPYRKSHKTNIRNTSEEKNKSRRGKQNVYADSKTSEDYEENPKHRRCLPNPLNRTSTDPTDLVPLKREHSGKIHNSKNPKLYTTTGTNDRNRIVQKNPKRYERSPPKISNFPSPNQPNPMSLDIERTEKFGEDKGTVETQNRNTTVEGKQSAKGKYSVYVYSKTIDDLKENPKHRVSDPIISNRQSDHRSDHVPLGVESLGKSYNEVNSSNHMQSSKGHSKSHSSNVDSKKEATAMRVDKRDPASFKQINSKNGEIRSEVKPTPVLNKTLSKMCTGSYDKRRRNETTILKNVEKEAISQPNVDHAGKNSTVSTPADSLENYTPSGRLIDSVLRGRSSISLERRIIHSVTNATDKNDVQSLEITPVFFRGRPLSSSESVDLDSGEEISNSTRVNFGDSGYEKFKRTLRRGVRSSANTFQNVSAIEVNSISVPPLPESIGVISSNDAASSVENKKVAVSENVVQAVVKQPEQTSNRADSDKMDGKSSTVVIYKNSLGEKLILASDQREDSDYDYMTAWDTSDIMVIDDLRQFKTPIRTSKARNGNLSSPLVIERDGGGGSGISATTTASSNCEQRKWGEILQHHRSRRQQNAKHPLPLSGTTNDGITTINYGILEARGRRRNASASKSVEANDSGEKPAPRFYGAGTSGRSVGGNAAIQKATPACDPKKYVLNFRIKVPTEEKRQPNIGPRK